VGAGDLGERSGIEGRDSGGGWGERRWRDPCPRGAKRMDDDVEAAVMAMASTYR
jgi:hypothetical protein